MGQREVLTVHAFFRPVMLLSYRVIELKFIDGNVLQRERKKSEHSKK